MMPIADPSSLLPLAPRDFLILLALTDGQQHGYGLVKAVAAASGGAVSMDPANLYRALKRMRRDGLVEETDGDEQMGAERRRYYALTDLGRRVVKAEAQRVDRLAWTVRAKKLVRKPEAR